MQDADFKQRVGARQLGARTAQQLAKKEELLASISGRPKQSSGNF